MAQVSWVYLDDFGGQHRVGLYHGDRTGHVLLHCDLRIVQVDFSVKEPCTYSFFVEDELCQVSIFKEKTGYSYDFQVNKKIDTPRNRLRKEDDRRNRKYIAIMLAGFVVFVSCIFLGLRWWGNQHRAHPLIANSLSSSGLTPDNELSLAAEGKSTVAQMVVVDEAQQRRVFYAFVTDEKHQISGQFAVPDTGLIVLPNGFPLADGDAFLVRYLPKSPRIHLVDFEQPTQQTITNYLERAYRAETLAHPAATPGHSRCVAQLALQQKGWRQLAALIFQSKSVSENARHNQDAYLRLVREPEFARLIATECWDE